VIRIAEPRADFILRGFITDFAPWADSVRAVPRADPGCRTVTAERNAGWMPKIVNAVYAGEIFSIGSERPHAVVKGAYFGISGANWRRSMASAGARFPSGVAPIMATQPSTASKVSLKECMFL
jgi:hypothetical protein